MLQMPSYVHAFDEIDTLGEDEEDEEAVEEETENVK